MAKKDGDPDCEHEWEYDHKVKTSNPPRQDKICTKCGRVETETGSTVTRSRFQDYYREFHGS